MFRKRGLVVFSSFLVVSLAFVPGILADDDEEGLALTVWWVVFNNPGPPPPSGVFHATGGVSDEDGNITFVSSLYESPDTLRLGDLPPPPFGQALTNAPGAAIVLVVRSHGPVIEELADEQITTFVDPACGNQNVCEDIQRAVFGGGQTEAVLTWIPDGTPVEGASARIIRYDDYVTLVLRTNVNRDDDDDSSDDDSSDDE